MTDLVRDDLIHIADYFSIFHRRKWRMLWMGFAILAVAIAGAVFWPPTYQSSATILIEEADVPNDLVKSTVSAFADERLQSIQQRVMTTQNLANIINKFNLYADNRQSQPINLIIDFMRTKIDMEIVSADTTDPKSGRPTKAAIAFTLSFAGTSPQQTQQVTNELVTLYLSENQRAREEQATSTASFLIGESQRLQTNMVKLENDLANFKIEHSGLLPEDMTVNSQLLDRTGSQLLDVTRQIQALRERQTLVQAQLAQTDPSLEFRSADPSLLSPNDQLKALQSKYAELSAKYGPQHPDVVSISRQIDILKAAGATGWNDPAALGLQVQSLETTLQAARQRYGEKHPDVVALERKLQTAKNALAAAPSQMPTSMSATSPAYRQIQVQLASINGEIAATETQQRAVEQKAAQIEERILKAPEIERDYVALKRDYDDAVVKYQEVKAKENEAEIAQNLESERMGEKLSVIEPPLEPIAPIKPNRPVILALGLFLAIAGGIGAGVLKDLMAGRLYGSHQLEMVLGQTPMAVVPFIRTTRDRLKSKLTVISVILLCCLICAVILVSLNLFVAPLNVLWAALLNRFGIF
jgi:uncharacterized protein involved in exopolysaccharide biosynthesis